MMISVTSKDLVCEWCHETFVPSSKRGPVPKYCSPAHRQRAFEARKRHAQGAAEQSATSPLAAAFADLEKSAMASNAFTQISETLASPMVAAAFSDLQKDVVGPNLFAHLTESLVDAASSPLATAFADLQLASPEELSDAVASLETKLERIESYAADSTKPMADEAQVDGGDKARAAESAEGVDLPLTPLEAIVLLVAVGSAITSVRDASVVALVNAVQTLVLLVKLIGYADAHSYFVHGMKVVLEVGVAMRSLGNGDRDDGARRD